MPNLNEFVNKPDIKSNLSPDAEFIDGIRGCSKCKEDVEGAYWSNSEKKMTWVCSSGHVTEFEVD